MSFEYGGDEDEELFVICHCVVSIGEAAWQV